MKKGETFTLEGSDEENDYVNQSLRDIQMNPMLTQEQRRTRVETEVNFINFNNNLGYEIPY